MHLAPIYAIICGSPGKYACHIQIRPVVLLMLLSDMV